MDRLDRRAVFADANKGKIARRETIKRLAERQWALVRFLENRDPLSPWVLDAREVAAGLANLQE